MNELYGSIQVTDSITTTLAARELLQNPAFTQATEKLREHYVGLLLGTSSDERDKREEIYRRVSVLGSVIAELADLAQNPVETAH